MHAAYTGTYHHYIKVERLPMVYMYVPTYPRRWMVFVQESSLYTQAEDDDDDDNNKVGCTR